MLVGVELLAPWGGGRGSSCGCAQLRRAQLAAVAVAGPNGSTMAPPEGGLGLCCGWPDAVLLCMHVPARNRATGASLSSLRCMSTGALVGI